MVRGGLDMLQQMYALFSSVEELGIILHRCRTVKNVSPALNMYVYICQLGLDSNPKMSGYLISTLMAVGYTLYAQQVYERSGCTSESVWNLLIIHYVKDGDTFHALNLYQKSPSFFLGESALIALLKACAHLQHLEMGQELHSEIVRRGLLERDIFVGCTMVDMYSKCGSLQKAIEVFEKLLIRNVVSWTVLVAAYAQHGLYEEALSCLDKMHLEEVSPNVLTLVCCLKSCGFIASTEKGNRTYATIVRYGWEGELLVGNASIDMYAKCGSMIEAQKVFIGLPSKDVVSWTTLMAGYVDHGAAKEALHLLQQMHDEGIPPNSVTNVCSLKACSVLTTIFNGHAVHSDITSKGMEKEKLICSTIIDMYIKCGFLVEARKVFDGLSIHDVVSWTMLIAGYTEYGFGEEALQCVKLMNQQGIQSNAVTYMYCLKACGRIAATRKGQEIHAEVIRRGFEAESFIGNTLIEMYIDCDLLETAEKVFEVLPVRDLASWNILTSAYVEYQRFEEVVNCFEQMQHEGSPGAVMYMYSLKACGSIKAEEKGRDIHRQATISGLDNDLLVGSALIAMYAGFSSLSESQDVFDRYSVRDTVSWTALINAYSEHGCEVDAVQYVDQMRQEGFSPNPVTLICIVKACSRVRMVGEMQTAHAEIIKKGFEEESIISNTLVDVYAKCGLLGEASELFQRLPSRDVVSGTILVSRYVENGYCEKALKFFHQMQEEDYLMNSVTYGSCLKACGSIGATREGQLIHSDVVKKGFDREIEIGNGLIDMYAKCSFLLEAKDVFHKFQGGDVISWNSLIAGYAQSGDTRTALDFLRKMMRSEVKPNSVTFLNALNACSDAGLVDKGQMLCEVMQKDGYDLIPGLDHVICMVDLLGRAGDIDKAMRVVEKMPFHPNVVAWHSMLGACRKWSNADLGKRAFEHAVYLDDQNLAPYIFMSNIYADLGTST